MRCGTMRWHDGKQYMFIFYSGIIGRIRMSLNRVNRIYEFSGVTHVTPFHRYRKHSTGPVSWVRTHSEFGPSQSVLPVESYSAQSNVIHIYGRESHGSLARMQIDECGHWYKATFCQFALSHHARYLFGCMKLVLRRRSSIATLICNISFSAQSVPRTFG